MPYNSAATQMKISDSMVGWRTASRPHRKSTPGTPKKRRIETARERAVRILAGFKGSIIMMDTGWARIVSGPFKSERANLRERCPQIGTQQLTRAMAATRPAGGAGPAALLG